MKIRIVIILLIINCLNLYLEAQIKDGRYIEILRQSYLDGTYITEIKNNNIKKYYYTLDCIDSTIGKFTIRNGYMNVKWNKKPVDIHQIRVYKNPNQNKSKHITFIVLDKNNNPIIGGATVLVERNSKGGITNSLGRLSILRDDLQYKISITGIGYKSLKFDCDTLGCKESDSIIIRLKDWNLRYIELPDKKYLIRKIDTNGFELLQGNGGYVQYLKADFYEKQKGIKHKANYTKEEYDNILKY